MTNFASLLTEWRAAVISEATSSGKPPLLLTAAVYYSVNNQNNNTSYPVNSIIANLNWVNVMNYDYQGPEWRQDTTYPHAALDDPNSSFNTKTGISAWIAAGLPPNKIALGLPFYGYAWKLRDPKENGINAKADGKATGNGIDGDGSITYKKIKTFIQANSATKEYVREMVTNYCYAGTTWIGYDDVESIENKVSFAKDKGLLGYFAWRIGGDDSFLLSTKAASKWKNP